jgi:signal transduction histidine kinase
MARWHALWLKPDLTPEIEGEVNIERLLTMARHQPVAAPAHAVNSVILTVSSWPIVTHHWLLVLFVILFQTAAIWQLRVWWMHRHDGRPSRVSDRAITRATIWSLYFGGVWGFFTAVLLASAPGRDLELLICTVIAGISAGGAMMLYPIPVAMVSFLIFSVGPPWVVMAFSENRVSHALMLYTLVYIGFLLITGRYSYQNFVEGVRLRLQNADLAYKAEAASRAKSRFLANMSHELRTPLNAIIGFAEVIHHQFKGPVGNPQYIEFARSIHESGRHLVGIINDILDLSKVEAGKVVLEEQPTTVAALVDQVAALMNHSMSNAQLTLDIAIDPALPEILVDIRKIDQVLLNLISNAVKFTPPGGRIRIEGHRAPDGGMVIKVADTGSGIAADELGEVLKPFVQSRDAERRRVQGTGLGLPLADELVKLHGGTMALASAPGEGTTVTVYLPPARVSQGSPMKAFG